MLGFFFLVLIIFFVVFPDFLIDLFFHNLQNFDLAFSAEVLDAKYLAQVKSTIRTGLIFIAVYMIIEDIRWLINGILTAAGDTLFLMIAGASCVWLFLLLPTYFFVMKPQANIKLAFVIWIVYSVISTLIFYLRFRQGKWKLRSLVIDYPKPEFSASEITLSTELQE
jgi:MATE family multidrug resistance protein